MTELAAGIVGHDRDVLVAFYTDVLGFTLAQEAALSTPLDSCSSCVETALV